MVLLDTKSLIWWVNRHSDLSVAGLAAIEGERPGGEILISAVSAWEITVLAEQKRLGLRMEPLAWLARIGDIPEIRFVPMDSEIAVQSALLPPPAPVNNVERILAATARRFGCAVVTCERKLRNYPHIRAIW